MSQPLRIDNTSSSAADVMSVRGSFRFAFSSLTRVRIEVLSGLAVTLALVPEAIAFAVVAGLDPAAGLYTSAILAMVLSVTGGRPGMVTGAAGATALVVGPVAREHGMDYLGAAVLLGGIIQLVLGALGVAKLQRFIPRSVMLSSCTNCDTGGNKLERVRDLRFISFSELFRSRIVSVGIYILNPVLSLGTSFDICSCKTMTEVVLFCRRHSVAGTCNNRAYPRRALCEAFWV